jgi:tetratricopeptide (TPR) repeat protein
MVLSRLGLIYLMQNKLDEAKEVIEECCKLAEELPDVWYQWVSLRDLARLARYRKDFSRLDELESKMQAYLQLHPKPDERAWGMLHLELGNLALGQGRAEHAIEHYYQGIKILAVVGNYGGDTPPIYLERVEKEFFRDNLHLPAGKIRLIGSRLLDQWQIDKYHIHYPKIRAVFYRWANWQEAKE